MKPHTFHFLIGAVLIGIIAYFPVRQNSEQTRSDAVKSSTKGSDRTTSLESITKSKFSIHASSMEGTLAYAKKIIAADPSDSNGRIANLLIALCDSGKFQTASLISCEGCAHEHPDWIKLAFTRWAQLNPEEAQASLEHISDPQKHSIAFHAFADGWNTRDSAALATYAVSLPQSVEMDYALKIALDNWSLQDPAALSEWLASLTHGTAFDAGAAMMVSKSDGENCSPEVAAQWVANIQNPTLRKNSLLHVIKQWNKTDPAAAENYLTTAAWLDDAQRQEMRDSLNSEAVP